MKTLEGLYAAVLGTPIRGIAAPRVAATTTPTTVTTSSVFGLCARPEDSSSFFSLSLFPFSSCERSEPMIFLSWRGQEDW